MRGPVCPSNRARSPGGHCRRVILVGLKKRSIARSSSPRRSWSASSFATFKEFPPRQKAASFTIDQAMEKLEAMLTSGH
jgi:hypothetical protein